MSDVGIPDWVRERFLAETKYQELPPAPPEISLCQHITLLGTPEAPPEFCLEETLPGSEHCTAHTDPDQDDWDRHREQRSS